MLPFFSSVQPSTTVTTSSSRPAAAAQKRHQKPKPSSLTRKLTKEVHHTHKRKFKPSAEDPSTKPQQQKKKFSMYLTDEDIATKAAKLAQEVEKLKRRTSTAAAAQLSTQTSQIQTQTLCCTRRPTSTNIQTPKEGSQQTLLFQC